MNYSMTLVEIYTLEDTKQENVVSTLAEGEHTIGRGDILNCNDKRVSRKHALINVGKDIVTIKAVHVNPCFFKTVDGNSITILPKDTSVALRDGDQFALLADVFWFRVRVILNNDGAEVAKNAETESLKNVSNSEITVNNESSTNVSCSKSEVKTLNVSADVNSIPSTSKRCLNENLIAQSFKRQKKSDEKEEIESNMNTSEDASSKPTSLLNLDMLLDTSQNILNKNSKREQNLGANIDPGKLISNLKTIVEEDYGSRKEDEKRKTAVSDATNVSAQNPEVDDALDNNSVRIKQEKPDENMKVNVSDSEAEKENNEGENSKPNNSSIKVKTEKDEHIDCQTNNNEQNKSEDNQTNNNEQNKHEDNNQTNEQGKGEGSSNNNINGENDASCSTNNQDKKTRRERCWYGPTCYRKNPIHRLDLSHPGDDDYDSDPEDDRPVCPFGDACYRRNIEHRRRFLHLNPPAPNPNRGDGKPTKKRKSPKKKPKNNDSGDDQSNDDGNNSGDGTTPRKRKAALKKTYYDSPLDDYDYDDPFLDDASSDEYQLSSDDDDDDDETTEWEDSQKVDEKSQETRRLLKEAKRFTKAKGKKKD